jgi:hypothetical protein
MDAVNMHRNEPELSAIDISARNTSCPFEFFVGRTGPILTTIIVKVDFLLKLSGLA